MPGRVQSSARLAVFRLTILVSWLFGVGLALREELFSEEDEAGASDSARSLWPGSGRPMVVMELGSEGASGVNWGEPKSRREGSILARVLGPMPLIWRRSSVLVKGCWER